MKRFAVITLISILFAPLLMAGPAGASVKGDRQSVIIMFHDPAGPEDLNYLRAIGGVIRYTYSIINGVAVDLPVAAVEKLRVMQQNPSSPVSDPIARRISYIEDDGVMHVLDDGAAPAERPAPAVQPLPESVVKAVAGLPGTAIVLPFGNMYAFPVLPPAMP